MKVIDVKELMPPEGKYVLVYTPDKPWGDDDDPIGLFWTVAKLVRGISQEERDALPKGDDRKITYHSEDEHANNLVPYIWETFGPVKHWGQEVVKWAYLPVLT